MLFDSGNSESYFPSVTLRLWYYFSVLGNSIHIYIVSRSLQGNSFYYFPQEHSIFVYCVRNIRILVCKRIAIRTLVQEKHIVSIVYRLAWFELVFSFYSFPLKRKLVYKTNIDCSFILEIVKTISPQWSWDYDTISVYLRSREIVYSLKITSGK